MSPITLRPFAPADAPALRAVFHASVHGLGGGHYSGAQLAAWAPLKYDTAQWTARLQANQPWVALAFDGITVTGFADVQANGEVDLFYVAPAFARQGVGRALMAQLHAQAGLHGTTRLSAHVSLAAEAFFAVQGFAVQERQTVQRAGVQLRNVVMEKRLVG